MPQTPENERGPSNKRTTRENKNTELLLKWKHPIQPQFFYDLDAQQGVPRRAGLDTPTPNFQIAKLEEGRGVGGGFYIGFSMGALRRLPPPRMTPG